MTKITAISFMVLIFFQILVLLGLFTVGYHYYVQRDRVPRYAYQAMLIGISGFLVILYIFIPIFG